MLQYVGSSALAAPRADSRGTTLEQVKDLVVRYPNLSEIELARLINLYRQLSALDMALMLSDESLAPSLDRFSKENRAAVRPPFRQYAGLLAYAALTIGTVIWAIAVATA
jgi:hypothetical protein